MRRQDCTPHLLAKANLSLLVVVRSVVAFLRRTAMASLRGSCFRPQALSASSRWALRLWLLLWRAHGSGQGAAPEAVHRSNQRASRRRQRRRPRVSCGPGPARRGARCHCLSTSGAAASCTLATDGQKATLGGRILRTPSISSPNPEGGVLSLTPRTFASALAHCH